MNDTASKQILQMEGCFFKCIRVAMKRTGMGAMTAVFFNFT